ncbi:MucB/RseB C-terminal domain-containing protein [Thiohalomonas denitrificans]|uniref:Sigma E regulatory protein, MucB/RseB n=1 Tax=Thiohalomonas denitrificans TaxID=415747 RepID=A0A1G5QCY0_9GAMM|nr:MucB/RseB C-terminal domain-containing protein [Thiohalomonas denitrificans]SCZ59537.1 sigma E regulatory protein, MucB/RseB [Thiohalomonas denitrificans]
MAKSKTFMAVLLFLFFTPLSAVESQDPIAWLERMSRSAQELDYEGVFVYRSGDQPLQTLRIIHSGEKGKERLIALSGPLREVIREGNRVACLLPGQSSLFIDPAGERGTLPLRLPSQFQALQRFYEITFDGEGRVANLGTRKVKIRPKDQFRYGHNYWIAGDSGLLLRAELLDERESVIEEVVFTSVKVHERIPLRMLESETSAVTSNWQELDKTGEQVENSTWKVENAPPGFEKVVHRRRSAAQDAPSAEHLVLTDGLASVSIFIEPTDENHSPAKMRQGPLNARMEMVDHHRVTVVGEVPAAAAERIADGVRSIRKESQ